MRRMWYLVGWFDGGIEVEVEAEIAIECGVWCSLDGDEDSQGAWRDCSSWISQAIAPIDSSIPQSAKSPGRTCVG